MYCVWCGSPAELRANDRGLDELWCLAFGEMLSSRMTERIVALAENPPTLIAPSKYRMGGYWCCPADGTHLIETDGRVLCPECGRQLTVGMIKVLTETQWHAPLALTDDPVADMGALDFAEIAGRYRHLDLVPELLNFLHETPEPHVHLTATHNLAHDRGSAAWQLMRMDRPGRHNQDIAGAETHVALLNQGDRNGRQWLVVRPGDPTFFLGVIDEEMTQILSAVRVTRLGEFNKTWEPDRPRV